MAINFEKKLNLGRVKKWTQHYINYSKLKNMVNSLTKARPPSSPMPMSINLATQSLLSPADKFFGEFEKELEKVERFYRDQIALYEQQFELLDSQVTTSATQFADADIEDSKLSAHLRESESMKRAFTDLYRNMMFLQNFALLNTSAFVKILKKHDHVTGNNLSAEYGKRLDTMEFVKSLQLTDVISKTERLFANSFCEGHLEVARGNLLIKQGIKTDWVMFGLAMRLGALLLLMIWVAFDFAVDDQARPTGSNLWVSTVFPVYRGVGCMILVYWLWGFNLFVWNKFRINYLFLFELDPRTTQGYRQVWHRATRLSIVFFANFLLYLKVLRGDFPNWISVDLYPFITFLLFLMYMCWALRPYFGGGRNVWARALGSTIAAPFGEVTFLTGYIGDMLTSMVKVLVDIAYGFCFIFSTDWVDKDGVNSADTCMETTFFSKAVIPLLSALPLWFRFMQCLRRYKDTHKRFPFLANAGKYAIAQSVVVFGIFHSNYSSTGVNGFKAAWILFLIISTLYSFLWDVYMDWGLGQFSHKFLRKRLMFRNVIIYYVCIVIDLLLRFMWTLTLIPASAGSPLDTSVMLVLNPCLAAFELCRRSMWGCFRLEHEHLHNTEGFRGAEIIPLHFDTPVSRPVRADRSTGRRILLEVSAFALVVVVIALAAMLTSPAWKK